MRKAKFFRIVLMLSAVLVLMSSFSHGGTVPQTLNYQGTLTDRSRTVSATWVRGGKAVTVMGAP